MSWSPFTAWIGEQPGFPQYETTPGGGVTTRRELHCLAQDVGNWMLYFIGTNPLCPYTNDAVVWKISQRPFETQRRTQELVDTYGPAVAEYDWSLLSIEYRSQGMRYYPGFGVVQEEVKPRMEQEPVGILRQFSASSTTENTLSWSDGKPLYYEEHPHFESGGKEVIFTFPFAGTGAEPFQEGTLNSDPVTAFVSGDTYPRGTLKYMGCAKEASVVIPSIGIYLGLIRYRKSFIFHYRNPANANTSVIDWNKRWRARDQTWNYMQDENGSPYYQYPYAAYGGVNWWI